MMHNPQTDDEIIAEDRRRYRRRMQETLIPLLTLLGLLWLLMAAEHFHLLAPLGISQGVVVAAERYVPFALLLLLIPALFRNWPRKEARSERILRRQIDAHAVRWRWVTIMFLIALPVMANNAVMQTAQIRHSASWANQFQPLALVFVVLIIPGAVAFGYGFARKSYREALSDELARALQRPHRPLRLSLAHGDAGRALSRDSVSAGAGDDHATGRAGGRCCRADDLSPRARLARGTWRWLSAASPIVSRTRAPATA